ncbi:hypothetical protein HUJ05_002434 [Dendroctonus ponderosae]|nr:hypothetical protein HUJ05_002434 [Dendroctonus ponderosae]KAH1029140.1 hypothetical protein HUJ05_002434 [Dendroctonus ponderosae]
MATSSETSPTIPSSTNQLLSRSPTTSADFQWGSLLVGKSTKTRPKFKVISRKIAHKRKMKVHELADTGPTPGAVDQEMAGAQDTIYLCNFRVSVDGEWLCLKELQDVEFNMHESVNGKLVSSSHPEAVPLFGRDPAVIERSNLVNISKLVVKELIEQSLKYGRMLDSDHMPLQHFFIVLEHVLRHGLKPKKGLLGPKKELWDILQMVEKYAPEAQDITASVRDLPTVRTHLGRARAWLRLALMQKKLADYLKVLLDHKDEALAEYFEPDALMLSDEAIVIIGLLVGLNVIDCNLCVKEEDLDCPQGVIDFSLYLRSPSHVSCDSASDEQDHMTKVESLTTTNVLMKEDMAIARNNLLALYDENRMLREQIGMDPAGDVTSFSGANIVRSRDSEGSADTGDIEQLRQRLEEEQKQRQEADHELEIQTCLKAEMEVAMKLLEKDIHEKQDTIVSLRRQLDDIKLINLEMYKKLQECETELTQKGEMVSRLQAKASQIGKILNNLEKYNHLLRDDRKSHERRVEKRQCAKLDNKASSRESTSSKRDEARLSSDSTDSFVKLDLESDDRSPA